MEPNIAKTPFEKYVLVLRAVFNQRPNTLPNRAVLELAERGVLVVATLDVLFLSNLAVQTGNIKLVGVRRSGNALAVLEFTNGAVIASEFVVEFIDNKFVFTDASDNEYDLDSMVQYIGTSGNALFKIVGESVAMAPSQQ